MPGINAPRVGGLGVIDHGWRSHSRVLAASAGRLVSEGVRDRVGAPASIRHPLGHRGPGGAGRGAGPSQRSETITLWTSAPLCPLSPRLFTQGRRGGARSQPASSRVAPAWRVPQRRICSRPGKKGVSPILRGSGAAPSQRGECRSVVVARTRRAAAAAVACGGKFRQLPLSSGREQAGRGGAPRGGRTPNFASWPAPPARVPPGATRATRPAEASGLASKAVTSECSNEKHIRT